MRAEDIGGVDARGLDVVDVRSIESEVFLFRGELFAVGDHVNIRLAADGIDSRTLRMIVDYDKEAKVIDADHPLLQEFMSDMAYNLARRGQLNFYIDGELLDISQQTFFDFEVKNIFDFKIRY